MDIVPPGTTLGVGTHHAIFLSMTFFLKKSSLCEIEDSSFCFFFSVAGKMAGLVVWVSNGFNYIPAFEIEVAYALFAYVCMFAHSSLNGLVGQ